MGENYDNGVPKEITLVQNKDSIKIIRKILTYSNQDSVITRTIKTNGKPIVKAVTELRRKEVTVEMDVNSFVVTVKYFISKKNNSTNILATIEKNLGMGSY